LPMTFAGKVSILMATQAIELTDEEPAGTARRHRFSCWRDGVVAADQPR
jgi:hypothetical protein